MSDYIYNQYKQYKKKGERERSLREGTATKWFKAAKLTAAPCVIRIYIVALYILTGIQTCTVDKAAIISSRQLLLLLFINLSLPLRISYLFLLRADTKLIVSTFSKMFYGLSKSTVRDLFCSVHITWTWKVFKYRFRLFSNV